MTYQETLDYLYRHLPMFQRVGPVAYKKDLTNTLALCEHLGNPQHKFKSIHVAGTNGKGSVSHMLAAICQTAGYKTGLYISPHYKDFRERIKIDGQYIPRRRVVDFVANNLDAIERIQPSFFELCVAMAFDHFAREKVDVAIVEVGLGGRLDSTNVITPLLSVITNISYDHQNLLGDTLPEIAGEKAGIIKPGIPVVIGETHPESAPVFEKKARDMKAPIVFADQHFKVSEKAQHNWTTTNYAVEKDGKSLFQQLKVAAAGPFQTRNIATVLQACEWIPETALPGIHRPEVLAEALAHIPERTRFMGRWQVIGEKPLTLCDSAHNEAGLRLAFERIRQMPYRQLHIVTGFVNDKDVSPTLGHFPVQARYYFAKADIPRGLEATILQEKAAVFELHGRAYSSVRNALRAARRAASPDDMIVVIGSIFVVAEVL
ncbi:MAG: bifunctional folylpolyglutamate synthase/dihydrofolate synthase [Saprospiraceae bacterium]|nr:bifunctional folylpolyglutamate synthase/dihydrofolate synthase [Saprospiraceae bacterium]